jgi:hypothetical protein
MALALLAFLAACGHKTAAAAPATPAATPPASKPVPPPVVAAPSPVAPAPAPPAPAPSRAPGAICLEFGPPRQVGAIQERKLFELSGLAASRAHPGILYAHGDSGSKARLFAIDTEGTVRADYRLPGIERTDWEDIAVGPGPGGGPSVFVGDIGDNGARKNDRPARAEIQIVRFAEPALPDPGVEEKQIISEAAVLRFQYPDHAHDAETLMLDPLTGDLLIVTKDGSGRSSVFRAAGAAASAPGEVVILERVADLSLGSPGTPSARATAGDISPTGDRVLLRTYGSILLWPRPPGRSLADVFATAPRHLIQPAQAKGEAIAFTADGRSWFAAGEADPALYRADQTCNLTSSLGYY